MTFRSKKDGVIVSVYVHPLARKDGIGTADGLVVHKRKPLRGNKTNTSVIAILSESLGIQRGDISSVRGSSGRNKKVLIMDLSPEGLDQMLGSIKPR